MRRRLLLVLATALVAAGIGACGDREEVREEVLAALRRTESLSYRYVYRDQRPDAVLPQAPKARPDVEVQGLVEDDFRFKARVAFDGVEAYDEVVSDDLLAMRFREPARLSQLVNKDQLAKADTTTDLEGVDSLTALRSRRWVVDEAAAPSVTVGRVRADAIGDDPVLDSITVMAYVETAIREAMTVEEFSEDDLTPTYSSTEDSFPKPEEGSGVTRYDLRRPKLPPPGASASAGESGRPETRHFRKMAIYVKDGRVISVREEIDVRGRYLEEVVKYAKTYARAGGATDESIAAFEEALDTLPVEQHGTYVLEVLNLGLATSGDDPILQRTMQLELADLGEEIAVDLPTDNVVKGGLGFLIVSSKGKVDEDAPPADGATAAESATATSAPAASTSTAETTPAPAAP